ncbi:hypothetical protein D9M70_632940 [compost metagenome]
MLLGREARWRAGMPDGRVAEAEHRMAIRLRLEGDLIGQHAAQVVGGVVVLRFVRDDAFDVLFDHMRCQCVEPSREHGRVAIQQGLVDRRISHRREHLWTPASACGFQVVDGGA